MVQKVRNRPDTTTKREWCRRPLFARDNQIFLNKLLALQIRAAEKNFAKSPKFNQREVHKSWHGRRGLNFNIMCLMKIASFCNSTWGMRIPLRCTFYCFENILMSSIQSHFRDLLSSCQDMLYWWWWSNEELYRVTLVVSDLGWVDSDFECSTVCPTVPGCNCWRFLLQHQCVNRMDFRYKRNLLKLVDPLTCAAGKNSTH